MSLDKLFINISEEIHIPAEVEKWQRERSTSPTIVIDLKELSNAIAKIDEGGLLYGGRFHLINEILLYFFAELNRCNANLVFMATLDEGRFKDIDQFSTNFEALDCIKNDQSLKDHLNNTYGQSKKAERPNERIFYNLLSMCRNYGQLHVNYGLGLRAMLAYARENKDNVLALITRHAELMAFEDDFQYWSLSDVQFCELKIAKFCREKIIETFDLNSQQMQLLCAISLLREKQNAEMLLDFVKSQKCGPNGYNLYQMSGNYTHDQCKEIEERFMELSDLKTYIGPWNNDRLRGPIFDLANSDSSFGPVMQFYKDKIPFAYKLVNEILTVPKDLLFVDRRLPDSYGFIYMMTYMMLKLCGIAFKDIQPDMRPKTRIIYHGVGSDGRAIHAERDIMYPNRTVNYRDCRENLANLTMERNGCVCSRWSYLMWLLKMEKTFVRWVKNSVHSKHIRVVLLTLEFLTSHDIISARDADIILLTESDVENKRNANGATVDASSRMPPPNMLNDQYPTNVHISWISIAHKYTIAFELICHCLELSGLRSETSLIWFDGFAFLENMHQAENSGTELQSLLVRIQNLHL